VAMVAMFALVVVATAACVVALRRAGPAA
jgi:hypothetical protein